MGSDPSPILESGPGVGRIRYGMGKQHVPVVWRPRRHGGGQAEGRTRQAGPQGHGEAHGRWRDFALALGLTTMPISKAGTTPASRKPVLPCTYGAACTRDHRHLLLTHWTKGKATDYVKNNASLHVFKDPRHVGFHQELLDAITKAPASTVP